MRRSFDIHAKELSYQVSEFRIGQKGGENICKNDYIGKSSHYNPYLPLSALKFCLTSASLKSEFRTVSEALCSHIQDRLSFVSVPCFPCHRALSLL